MIKYKRKIFKKYFNKNIILSENFLIIENIKAYIGDYIDLNGIQHPDI